MNGSRARWLRQVADSVSRITPEADSRTTYRRLKRQYRRGHGVYVNHAEMVAASLRKLGI